MKTMKPTVGVEWHQDRGNRYYIVVRWKGKTYRKATGVSGPTKTAWRHMPEVLDLLDHTETYLKDFKDWNSTVIDPWGERGPERHKNQINEALMALARRRNFAIHTLKNYQRAVELYTERFGNHIVSVDETKGWFKQLRGQFTNSSLWSYGICLKSLFTFGVKEGLLSGNPFDWDLGREGYKSKKNPRARTSKELDVLREQFANGNIYAGIFLAGYTFCGLAMCDLLRLDWANLEVQRLGFQDFFVFTIERKKTNQAVKGVVKVNDESLKLQALMIEVTAIGKPVSYWTEKVNRQLGYLDFKPKLKYYECRHTYATDLIGTRAPLNVIASLLGKNVRGIETYIQLVNSNRVLADAVSVLTPLE